MAQDNGKQRFNDDRRKKLSLFINGNEIDDREEDDEYERLQDMSTGTLKYPDDNNVYSFSSLNLQEVERIGNGNFGTVYEMEHTATKRRLAVKKIRCNNVGRKELRRLIQEHATIVSSERGPNIVKFYGTIFYEGDCWICMELMLVSLDALYKRVYNGRNERLEENVIGHVAVCTIDALAYLKEELHIIHRDVKPSNILVNEKGDVKLCDFGICGKLEDSVAHTHDAGCRHYLSPERLSGSDTYDVRSDVWSLGITLYEISTGVFPYSWGSVFQQLQEVVHGDPPILRPNNNGFSFSMELILFVNTCLTKDVHHRPKYLFLKTLEFYKKYAVKSPEIERARETIGRGAVDTKQNLPEIHG